MEKYIIILGTILYLICSLYFIKKNKRDNIFNFIGLLFMSFSQTTDNNWYNYSGAIIIGCDIILMLYLTRKKKDKIN